MKSRKGLLAGRSRNSTEDIESVDIYFSDEGEDCGETTIIGKPIATFSFGAGTQENKKPILDVSPPVINTSADPQTASKSYERVNPRGTTPPIDGEHFSMKRGYQFRPSTIRKLNELKTKHPDINVYLNTILDAAILHYYDYIINKNGDFSS